MCSTMKLSKRVCVVGCVLCSCVWIVLLGGCAGFFPDERQRAVAPADESLFLEAQQLYDYGQFQRAINVWEQVLPSDPRYVDAQMGIRKARLKIEEMKDQQLVSSQRTSQIDTYIAQAQELEQKGDLTGAVQVYEEARQLDPKNIYLYNKIEELHALLDDTLERHARLGDIYLAQGAYEQSKAEWEQLLLLEPSNEKAQQRLADLEVLTATSDTIFVNRGRALLEKGLIYAAIAEFEKARRVNPANEVTETYLSKLQNVSFTEYTVQKGDTLSSIAQRYTGSSSQYQILADFNQLDANEPLRVGQIIRTPHVLGFKKALAPGENDGLFAPASSDQQAPESRTLQPPAPLDEREMQSLAATMNEGIAAYQEGRYREAMSLLQDVLLRDPDNEQAYAYFVKATEYIRRGPSGDDTRAVPPSAEEIVAEEDTQDSEAQKLLQAAIASREAGDLKAAIAIFEQAYQLDPENSRIIDELEETRDELKKLITAHLNEGIKYFNQDALEAAILEWEKVLELAPSHRQAADYKKRAETMLETLSSQ